MRPDIRWKKPSVGQSLGTVNIMLVSIMMFGIMWSEKPFDDAGIARIVKEMAALKLPPGMPNDVNRMVFVPAIGKRTARMHEGVRVVDAASVLACLR